MMDAVDRFQRQQAYERDCGASVLASLDSVPDANRPDAAGARAFAIAAHIQAARLLWLSRLTGSAAPPRIFFDRVELGEVERMTAEADAGWDRYIDELAPERLSDVTRYTSMAGNTQECPVADILTHVFNHGMYHRGQIAILVTQAGGEAAVTDFIFFAYREPLSP
ncbi:MAG: DinB family protein [Planctomycetota bacterium]